MPMITYYGDHLVPKMDQAYEKETRDIFERPLTSVIDYVTANEK